MRNQKTRMRERLGKYKKCEKYKRWGRWESRKVNHEIHERHEKKEKRIQKFNHGLRGAAFGPDKKNGQLDSMG
jgi:hypothetical protein